MMINVDGGGRFIRQNFHVHGPEELVPYLQKIADEIGYPMKVKTTLSTASDHWPFYLEGVPAASLESVPDPLLEPLVRSMGRGWGHTPADTVDKVDPRALREASLVLSQFLVRIANEEEFPIKHMEKKKILKYLEEKGVAEQLRIQKKWHPESIR
jgi:Zn-dependent M28 family amino/carboxypeptidase